MKYNFFQFYFNFKQQNKHKNIYIETFVMKKKLTYYTILLLLIIYSNNLNSQNTKTVPDFKVVDVYGNLTRLYDILESGQYVYIQFFSTGCGSCQDEAPIVNEVYGDLGCNGSDIFFFAIDYGSTDSSVLEFIDEFNMNYPSISGQQGGGHAVFDIFDILYTPYSLLISPEKEILFEEPLFETAMQLKDTIMDFGLTENLCKGTEFLYFALENKNNLQFENDIIGEITENDVNFYFNENDFFDFTSIIPSFVSSSFTNVYIDVELQKSDSSIINLESGICNYNLIAQNNSYSQIWNINIINTLDIENPSIEINVWPNPANDYISIECYYKISEITIFDQNGKFLKNIKLTYDNKIITSNFDAGVYFIKFKVNNTFLTRKIIIQH